MRKRGGSSPPSRTIYTDIRPLISDLRYQKSPDLKFEFLVSTFFFSLWNLRKGEEMVLYPFGIQELTFGV